MVRPLPREGGKWGRLEVLSEFCSWGALWCFNYRTKKYCLKHNQWCLFSCSLQLIISQWLVPQVELATAEQHIHHTSGVGKLLLDVPPIYWLCGGCWFISGFHVNHYIWHFSDTSSSAWVCVLNLIINSKEKKNCLTRYLTSRHNWDCLHPWDCLLPFTCPDVFHPAVHWVRAVVEWGAELPDGNQVSTSDLQDTPGVVSAYKEEKNAPSSLSCDGACCVITQIVAVVRCGAIFLMIKAKSVSCWSSIAKNAHNYWRCYVFWSIFYFVHPINHVWRTTFCCNFNLNIFTIFVILAAWHINPWFRGRPSTEFNVWRSMVTVNKWELIIDCE